MPGPGAYYGLAIDGWKSKEDKTMSWCVFHWRQFVHHIDSFPTFVVVAVMVVVAEESLRPIVGTNHGYGMAAFRPNASVMYSSHTRMAQTFAQDRC